MRKDKHGEREKAKLLVLAVLYKIGANLALNTASVASLRELLTKAENITLKFGLKYENTILEAIEKRRQAIEILEKNEEKIHENSSLCSFPGEGALDSYKSSPFIKDTKNPDQRKTYPQVARVESRDKDRSRSKSKNFVIKKSVEPYRARMTRTPGKERHTREPHRSNDLRASTQQRFYNSKQVPEPRGYIRRVSDASFESAIRQKPMIQTSNQGMDYSKVSNHHAIKKAAEARRDFKDGLDNLLTLGEYVKNEIKELNNDPRPIFKVKRRGADPIFDDSEDIRDSKPDYLDKEIASKIDILLQSQFEWQKQRSIFQEKLEKLEKNLERQTTNEENVNLSHSKFLASPKNYEPKMMLITPDSPNNAKVLTPYRKSTPCNKTSFPFLTPKVNQTSAHSGSSNYLTVNINKRSTNDSKKLSVASSNGGTPSAISDISCRTVVISAGLEGYVNALKYSIHQLEKEDFEPFKDEIRQIINKGDIGIFILGISITKGDSKGQDKIIKLCIYPYDTAIMAKGQPLPILAKEELTVSQLSFILKSIHAFDVLPSHKPASSFTSITFFLVHVLGKFVHLSKSSSDPKAIELVIQNIPRCMTGPEPPIVQFFGEDHSVSLIHMNEKTFRLVIRKLSTGDDTDAIFCEMILNEFVLANFFEFCAKSTEVMQKILNDDYVPNWDELERFKVGLQGNSKCVWMLNAADKKV